MVDVQKVDGNYIFEIKGLHKLWALRSQLTIPVGNVTGAHRNTEGLNPPPGFRMPGTQVPGLITAGTYLAKDGKIFCDVMDEKNAVVVELQDEVYTKLIIEVADAEATINLLTEH
jgi:hypothetical protein